MTTNEPEPKRSEDHEFPFMELFNAEDAIEHPGEPVEDVDPTDDATHPLPEDRPRGVDSEVTDR